MRITIKYLEGQVNLINRLTNSPEEKRTRVDGRNIPNVGNYHLSQSMGGVELQRVGNESGGTSDVSRGGHVSNKELSNWMSGFIAGLEMRGEG